MWSCLEHWASGLFGSIRLEQNQLRTVVLCYILYIYCYLLDCTVLRGGVSLTAHDSQTRFFDFLGFFWVFLLLLLNQNTVEIKCFGSESITKDARSGSFWFL